VGRTTSPTCARLIQALFGQILDTVVAIMRADFASIQLLDPARGPGGELRLLGHRVCHRADGAARAALARLAHWSGAGRAGRLPVGRPQNPSRARHV
jgi:hypothetical protein